MRKTASVALNQKGPMAAGWLVSCLLHGGLMIATLLFMQRMQVFPETELFRWNVAMVGAPPPSLVSTSSPASSAPPSESERSTPSVTKPVHPRTATQAPGSHAIPSRQSRDQAIRQPDTPTQSANESAPPSQDMSLTPVEPSPQLWSNSEPLQSVPDSSSAHQTDSENFPSPSIASIPSASPLPEGAQSNPARSDYGWLAELMAKWSQDLDKHYPVTLRTDGVQGKVILSALLHDTGVLSDIRVDKSSGNALLDQAAVEDVKNAPPIKLSHPLERPSLRVKIPIVYILNNMR